MKTGLIARAILFTITLPGVVVIAVPYCILRRSGTMHLRASSLPATITAAVWALSAAALLHSIWDFAAHGEGTLAPVKPPKMLVVRGLYRYTRNPMYLAVACMLLCEAILFRSGEIVMYAVLVCLLFYLFVLHYEEPTLHKAFGASWEKYTQAVPRWGIARRPYTPTNGPAAGPSTVK